MKLIEFLTSLLNADNTEEIEGYISELTALQGTPPTDEYKQKFEDLQKKYIERFTTGLDASNTPTEDDEDTAEEGEEITIDDLFKESEE